MNKKLSVAALAATSTLVCTLASAHVSTGGGSPAPANASQEITLQIGHGCEVEGQTTMTDTVSLKVDIPADVTGVRAVSSTDFPTLTLDKDGTGNVTAITWAKTNGGGDSDSQFYKLTFRAKMPNKPFTKVYFKAHQKCKAPGKDAEWIGVPGDGSGAEAAPEVVILPAKSPGWNKWTVAAALATKDDLKSFFKDAQIVWKGSSAYSANDVIAAQIAAEPGVTPLTSLAANDEIFVKY